MITYGILLTAIYLYREYMHDVSDKRKDTLIDTLTSKLMARDFTEYTDNTQTAKVYEPVAKDDEDLYYQEIQDNKR